MKNIFQILFIITLFNSCNSQNNRIENRLIECYNEPELVNEILEYEKELISNNILENGEPNSYIILVKKIRDNKKIKEFPEKNNGLLIIQKNKNVTIRISENRNTKSFLNCKNSIYKSSEFENSKIYKINQEISNSKNISIQIIAEKLLNTLSKSDYNLPFYKLYIFKMLIANSSFKEISKTNLRSPKWLNLTNKKTTTNKNNILLIKIDSKNKILVNEISTKINEIKNIAMEFLDNGGGKGKDNIECTYCKGKKVSKYSDHPNKAIISLVSERGTDYGIYISVQNEIVSAYNELRNREAKRLYNMSFEKLKEMKKNSNNYEKGIINEKIKKIKDMYPMNISEKEPLK